MGQKGFRKGCPTLSQIHKHQKDQGEKPNFQNTGDRTDAEMFNLNPTCYRVVIKIDFRIMGALQLREQEDRADQIQTQLFHSEVFLHFLIISDNSDSFYSFSIFSTVNQKPQDLPFSCYNLQRRGIARKTNGTDSDSKDPQDQISRQQL